MNLSHLFTYTVALGALLLHSPHVHADDAKPLQVVVSVKIIEFQATKGLETGLSAYFKKMPRPQPFGEVSLSGNAINNADLTFPSSTAAGLTVFLDRISMSEGDMEVVLQALADENKAEILFRPRAVVKVPGQTTLVTSADIPYEATQVVGATTVQAISFKPTGIVLNLDAMDIADDDGDYSTKQDQYIRLKIDAQVAEEGQRIVVALDDQLAAAGNSDKNAITVPEFILRKINTEVWVPEGEILILGGLYRNTENKTLSTVPFLDQGENMLTGLLDSLIPGNSLFAPLTTTIGNRSKSETRRELVFLIKAEAWSPSLSLGNDLGFDDSALFNIDLEEESNTMVSEDLIKELAEPAIIVEAPVVVAPVEPAPEGEKK
jgi:hypothetical protein